jgi:hypothetical protein
MASDPRIQGLGVLRNDPQGVQRLVTDTETQSDQHIMFERSSSWEADGGVLVVVWSQGGVRASCSAGGKGAGGERRQAHVHPRRGAPYGCLRRPVVQSYSCFSVRRPRLLTGGCSCIESAAGRRFYFSQYRADPAFELAILRAIFHSKGPKA